MVLAYMPAYGEDDRQVLFLAKSIRCYTGDSVDKPILVVVPEDSPLSDKAARLLSCTGAAILPFFLPQKYRQFPYAAKVFGAAAAESACSSGRIIWMDSDTLVLGQLDELVYASAKKACLSRVHLKNISATTDQPLHPFWQDIYQYCEVPESHFFTIQTLLDSQVVYAHFNAGLISVDVEKGIMQSWLVNFLRLEGSRHFEPFFTNQPLYRIFFHQAVLAGTLLNVFRKEDIFLLPNGYNYPIFLHDQCSVSFTDQVITCRYDSLDFFSMPDWKRRSGISVEQVKQVEHIFDCVNREINDD